MDRANLMIDFGAPVTSNSAAQATSGVGKPSEILLLWNDPSGAGGPVAGYGQNAAVSVCTTANAYADYALEVAAGGSTGSAAACKAFAFTTGGYWVMDSTGVAGGQAINTYQGAIGGATGDTFTANQVMFWNVPMLASGSNSVANTYRISNVRLTPGSLAAITATLSVSPLTYTGSTSPITGSHWALQLNGNSSSPSTATQSVASVASSLTVSMKTIGGVSLCTSSNLVPSGAQANRQPLPDFLQGEFRGCV